MKTILKKDSLNSTKLQFMLLNLLLCFPIYFWFYFVLTEATNIDDLASISITLLLYAVDVNNQTNADCLAERIKKLEDEHVKNLN